MSKPPSQNARRAAGAGMPDAAARLLGEAGQAMQQRRPDVAERLLIRALDLAPGSADGWRMLGLARHLQGLHAEAVRTLKRALELEPDQAMTHMALGIALHESGASEQAVVAFERACQLAPQSAACWFNLGKVLKLRDQHTEQACSALERALALDPAHLSARLTLADAQASLGRLDAAVGHYQHILRQQPNQHRAWLGLANIQADAITEQQTQQLRRALRAAEPGSEAAIDLGFALARALEIQGDHADAFATLSTANAAQRRMVHWNASTEAADLKAIREFFVQVPESAHQAEQGSEVIFVVSLPRAGSTLVEQILASHAQVEGAGEILDLQQVLDAESARRGQPFPQWVASANAADWARLGADYLRRTAHWRRDKPRFTDKNLLNWRLVGAALAMLPGARFVNCRRDPLETCLASYRQLFRTGNGFSYALDDMADYWKQYDLTCRHWRDLYPQRFIDFHYESLLAEPEAQIRNLLDFCKLDFDPDCLAFHQTKRVVRTASAAQVRQPLRRDTARAALYGEALAPLRAMLADTGDP